MRWAVLWAISLLLVPASGAARDLFLTEIEVDGQFASSGTNSLTEFGDIFSDESLEALFGSSYIPGVSAVAAALDLRGVSAAVSYPSGQNELRFVVPTAGIDLVFTGATRDESEEMLEEWLRGEGIPRAVPKRR